MLIEIVWKKVFGAGCKNQIFFIGDQNARRGGRMVEAWTYSVRRGEGFVGLGGYSAYQEATEILSQGSRQPCIPSLQNVAVW